MFEIGNIKICNRVGLAPMAGISNPAYMKICEDMGVGYAVTELISSEAVVRGNRKTMEMLKGIDELNIPVAVQLFGSNPNTIAKAAQIITKIYNKVFIDINMGCPVPKVAISSQAGSGLLRNTEKIYEIVKSTVESISVPVTVKIRSGWDQNSINAVEVAKIIESAGASAITVHPRTRSQGYSGKADWSIIKKVKESVKIPVIGNGDINSCFDAKRMIEETGCDAIMIGRAALGNPWIIKQCVEYLENGTEPKEITLEEKINMIKKHLSLLIKTKPYKVALLEMRNNASWYLKGIPNTKELKERIFKTKADTELIKLLDDYLLDL